MSAWKGAAPSATIFVQQKQQISAKSFRPGKAEGKNKRVSFEYSQRSDGDAVPSLN